MSADGTGLTARLEVVEETRPHPNLAVKRCDRVVLLRIDREEALGALSRGLVEALLSCFTEFAADHALKALVLTGTGRSFVAGADIREYDRVGQLEFDRYQRLCRDMFDSLSALPQATVCAVNGFALGGGFELALSCDFILASEKARLGLPEIKLGLIPGGGATQRLTRAVGRMRAKSLIMRGGMIGAEEALNWGAVLSVHEPAALLTAALDLAGELAEHAPLALCEAKRVIDDGCDTSLPAGLTLEQRALGSLYASHDAREGVAAFLEKRPPVFRGS